MATATNADTTIYYETIGSSSDPAMLLVMGLGVQLVSWPDEFCQALADRGFFVIRHDNRDIGMSSRTPGPPPDVMSMFPARLAGLPFTATTPYTLSDMSDDALAVLDDLAIDRAHVVGASMGGMIAQTMAIEHPERLHSLTSIMSTPFAPVVGPSTPEATAVLMTPPATDRAGYIDSSVRATKVFSGPHVDVDRATATAGRSWDRGYNPVGAVFQMAAVLASGDRRPLLSNVTTPTLVIHGRVDPLVTLPGGEATAAAIPGAELLVLDEMGHNLPEPLWPEIVDSIVKLAEGSA